MNQTVTEVLRDMLALIREQARELDFHRQTIAVLLNVVHQIAGGTADPIELPPSAADPEMLERVARGVRELERMVGVDDGTEKTDDSGNVSE